MRKASFAEAVLCRLTHRNRAAAIVGDLFEIEAREGKPLAFWFSFARIAFALIWRPLVAFLTALYIGLWLFGPFVTVADSTQASHYPPSAWEPAFGPLIFIGSISWAAAIYLIVRYSSKDRSAQLAFAWTCVISAVILFWWQPIALSACAALAFFLVSLSVFDKRFRREGLLVFISLLFGAALRYVAVLAAGYYQYYLGHHLGILWGPKELQYHSSICWVYFAAVVLTFRVTITVWTRMHDWVVRTESQDARESGTVVSE